VTNEIDTESGKYCLILIDAGKKYLGGLLSKKPDPDHEPSTAEQKIYDLISGVSEITSTLENVDMAAKLIAMTPPRSKSLNKAAYFSFLIGAYLQEIYILDQRMHTYAKTIARFYVGKGHESVTKDIMKSWVAALQPLIATRGEHVHIQRYSDPYVRILDSEHLIRSAKIDTTFDFDGHYADARYAWSRTTKANRKVITILIEEYFRMLQKIVAPDGAFEFPERFKDRKGRSVAPDTLDRR